jgi:hypothetical protein
MRVGKAQKCSKHQGLNGLPRVSLESSEKFDPLPVERRDNGQCGEDGTLF